MNSAVRIEKRLQLPRLELSAAVTGRQIGKSVVVNTASAITVEIQNRDAIQRHRTKHNVLVNDWRVRFRQSKTAVTVVALMGIMARRVVSSVIPEGNEFCNQTIVVCFRVMLLRVVIVRTLVILVGVCMTRSCLTLGR